MPSEDGGVKQDTTALETVHDKQSNNTNTYGSTSASVYRYNRAIAYCTVALEHSTARVDLLDTPVRTGAKRRLLWSVECHLTT